MGQSISGLSDILKNWYQGPVANQVNEDVAVTNLLDISAENLEGLQAVVPLHYGRSSGIGSRAELGTLPSAGAQKYDSAVFDLKYHYVRVQVSGPSIQKTNSQRGAFLQAMKSELDYIRNDLALDQSRQFYGDGTGVIAVVASVDTNTATLTSAEPLSKGYIYVGGVYDLGAPATPTDILNGVEVTDVDVDAMAVTFASSVASASANDVIVRHGNVSDTTDVSTNSEVDAGLLRILSSEPVGGIDPDATGKSFWSPQITDKSTEPDIDLDMLMVMSNQLANAGGKPSERLVLTSPGLVRRLFQSPDFKDAVRFVNSQTLKGGFEELSFGAGNGQMTLMTDRLAPWGDVMFIDKRRIKVYSPADWDFLSRDGLTVRWVPDVDAFQALLFRYINMGTENRRTSGIITGLDDTGF